MGNNVRIEQENLRTARVFIDGVEVKRVTDVNYSINNEETPVIKLEFTPNTLNFDGDLKLQVNLDSEELADEVIKRLNEKSRSKIDLIKI